MQRIPFFDPHCGAARVIGAAATPATPATPATHTTPAPAKTLAKGDLVSGAANAAIDVRKACNTIKRMTSIGTAAMVSGIDPKAAVEASREMAMALLRGIGFNTTDDAKLSSVMPMMMEATSVFLADAARNAPNNTFGTKELKNASAAGVKILGEVTKSRMVTKMIEPAWPNDIDSVTALRLTTSAAMAHVAIEIVEFDFMHSSSECIREAGKVIVKAATEASLAMVSSKTSQTSRLTLTQSLITSASKIYAAAWRAEALDQVVFFDSMEDAEIDAKLNESEKTALPILLASVNKRFATLFAAVAAVATETFQSDAAPPQPSGVATPMYRPRSPK